MASDGSVIIDVDVRTTRAQAGVNALQSSLGKIGIKDSASMSADKLAETLRKTKTAADEASQGMDRNSNSTDKDADAAKKAKAAQESLKSTLSGQAKYWDELSSGQEKAGLKVQSNVSHLNSLKAELGKTNIEVSQAKARFEQLSQAENKNESEVNEAQEAYFGLLGTQSKLGLEVSNLESKFGGLTPKMAAAADKAHAMADRFTKVGDKLTSVGKTATVGLTAPIVAGLGYATKSAIDFDSQIQSMGSLLDDGTLSSKALKAELSNLGDASKKWSTQYGTSTSDINNGMSELIKKGYSYNQVLGAMPSILDAARASGDDFNSVMSVSTSTLEQFGLKSNNTAQMLKNTQRVTDSLTFVANKTSAGFSDMGNAMEYVGPVAHGLNMSLEQTASMIGLMSNQGIEGEKAGTALRGSLSALLTPSKQNMIGFKNLGVSVEDFKKGALTMPQMLDNIKEKSKDMTKQQLQSNLALAFGTEAQTGMNILVNEGGDALRNLTKETQNSTGYTKKLAETMNNTSQANVQKFKAALNTLAITAGSQLLPEVTKLVKEGTKLVEWFSNLDEGTQQAIVKTLLFAAATGPALSGIGKMSQGLGALSNGYGNVIQWLGRHTSASVADAAAQETLAAKGVKSVSTMSLLKSGAVGLGTKLGLIAPAAEGGAAGLTALATTGGIVAGGLVVTGLAVAAGAAYWELYGKKAAESGERTKKWGSDIGSSADKSASKIQDFEAKATVALNDTSSSAKTNGKNVEKAFKGMADAAKDSAKQQYDAEQKIAKSVGGSAGKIISQDAESQNKSRQKSLKQMQSYYKQVQSITKNARDNNVALTADQKTEIINLQKQMAEESVKTMGLSAKQQRQVLAVLNGDIGKLSTETLGKMASTSNAAIQKGKASLDTELVKLEDGHKKGLISDSKYYEAKKAASNDFLNKEKTNLETYLSANIAYNQRMGDSHAKAVASAKSYLVDMLGLSKSEADALIEMATNQESAANSTVISTTKLSGAAKKAANTWNSLVLDPKTGKLKTNAVEEVQKGLKSEETWNRLTFLLKKGKMTTNAKAVMLEAVIANGQWYKLTFQEKKLLAKTNTAKTLMQALSDTGVWDNLKPKTQQLIAKAKTKTALDDVLKDIGVWDKLTPKQKDLLANAKTAAGVKKALKDIGAWKSLDPKIKNLIAKDLASANANAAYDAVRKFQGLQSDIVKKVRVSYSASGRQGALRAMGGMYATGTDYFPGGLAMVNDQVGPVYQEIITQHRTGRSYVLEGRNVIAPLERGDKVTPAAKSKKILDSLPHFADGLNTSRSYVPELASTFQPRATAVTLQMPQQQSTSELQKSVTDMLTTMNQLLAYVSAPIQDKLEVHVHTDLDKREMAHTIAPEIQLELNQAQRMMNRRNGVF